MSRASEWLLGLIALVLVSYNSLGCTQQRPAVARASKTPLKQALATLQPQAVWSNFYELTRIPRPSGHEQAVSRFVAEFGRKLGLETTVDSVGNVLIRKPASPGLEERESVALQAHLDMVSNKAADKVFDFEKDPVDTFVEAGWVKADRTTLGADDGIGVAVILAALQDRTLRHGPLEALFTVNEEETGAGVLGLAPGTLKSGILINVDWEKEGVFAIGSAGGVDVNVAATYREVPVPANMTGYTLGIDGLLGGHSGLDIDKGRGHAVALLARFLWSARQQLDLRVATFAGGTGNTVIPSQAHALVVVPISRAAELISYGSAFERTLKQELAASDPGVRVQAMPAVLPRTTMSGDRQQALIGALYASPNGVIRMSDGVRGLVETSSNLGVVEANSGTFRATIRVRSAVNSARDDLAQRLAAVFRLAGADAVDPADSRDDAWTLNTRSPVLALMKTVYQSRFGIEPTATAVHAGLEPAIIGATHPGLDMIAIGATILEVHTPNERVEVASVLRVYKLLAGTLLRIPERGTHR